MKIMEIKQTQLNELKGLYRDYIKASKDEDYSQKHLDDPSENISLDALEMAYHIKKNTLLDIHLISQDEITEVLQEIDAEFKKSTPEEKIYSLQGFNIHIHCRDGSMRDINITYTDTIEVSEEEAIAQAINEYLNKEVGSNPTMEKIVSVTSNLSGVGIRSKSVLEKI